MKPKLMLLNLLLLALSAGAAWRLREAWFAAHAREQAVLHKHLLVLPPPPIGKLPDPRPVQAASYADIALKTLFSKDRNPTVVVEAAPPPPPKPMPPLPILHGVMNLGDGPSAILSQTSKSPHKEFRTGDKIGEFKLLAIHNESLTLEWDGKQITKTRAELEDRSAKEQASAGGPQPAAQQAPAAPPPPEPKGEPKPGVDIGAGMRACQRGDDSPAGTEADGMRKVMIPSPFGTRCFWEAASK